MATCPLPYAVGTVPAQGVIFPSPVSEKLSFLLTYDSLVVSAQNDIFFETKQEAPDS